MWKGFAAALLSALAVVATDLWFSTSLLRVFRPVVTSPADGAIAAPPVVVHWEGPRHLLVTLVRSGMREELGLRESPFEIDRALLAQDGQYAVEIRSPSLGRFIRAERRFHLRRPPAARVQAADEASPEIPRSEDLRGAYERLRTEKNKAEADLAALGQEKAGLEAENRELAADVDELEDLHDRADLRLQELEGQQSTLLQEHLLAMQENQFLRQRLQSIPTCTAWGYLSLPRPQTVPPTRRVVVVSNGRGQVFRGEADCISVRRQDPTGISPCVCVGPVWDGMAVP
jgi:hypothetical protein